MLKTNCGNNYGFYHFSEKLIPLVLRNAFSGVSPSFYGDGKQVLDWINLEDHCCAISCVLEAGKVGETYNIGGWREKSNFEVLKAHYSVLDKLNIRADVKLNAVQITYIKVHDADGLDYVINECRIECGPKWKPREIFQSAIPKIMQWCLVSQAWAEKLLQWSLPPMCKLAVFKQQLEK